MVFSSLCGVLRGSRTRVPARTGPMPTAVVVSVLSHEHIDSLRARFDPATARGMPAHVTILYPFATLEELRSGVLDRLAEICGRMHAFDFCLERFGTFPGVTYLVPEPADEFTKMTAAIASELPAWPPYSGAYSEIIPHLTIAQHHRVPRAERRGLESVLPIRCSAVALDVLCEDEGGWRVFASVDLGGTSSSRR
ncbi:MAG: 2'-5' RNA ligase family protein [Actinomycetota bacterium]|nr:2'-5' RNA ligase family protein [Actinomycetota bacterium]